MFVLAVAAAAATSAAASRAAALPAATTAGAASHKVLWNSPWPSYCNQSVVDPQPDFSKFGVTANANNSFNGDAVTVIYCPTHFSLFPHIETLPNGTLNMINGGIPQRGDMKAHLIKVTNDIETLFPDKDTDAYLAIDWEVWVPWLIIATWSPGWVPGIYVNESRRYVRGPHPTWSDAQVDAEAIRSWNASALDFMEQTLWTARELRPRAKWGYYGRPGCYTGLNLTSSPPACISSVQQRNDALARLWRASSALYPSVYIGPNPKYPFVRTPAFVAGEINEARRLRSNLGLQLDVVAYTWYDLFDTDNESKWWPMRNATDLQTEFGTPKQAGADGIIVWGAGRDASTDARCASMATYVDSTLGPTLLRIASPAAEPPRPVFAESFTVSTVELDDTLNGSVSVRQELRRDSTARRSWMLANGTLVSGGLEEIMRCDIHPTGWFTTSGGSDATDPTTWACQNMSINSDPTSCQWNLFWEPMPANATYVGRESMDGRSCNRWTYWKWGEEYSLWASADTPNTPVATGKISTFGGDHKWRILWRNFTAGAPPLSAFEPTPGIQCPPANLTNN